jgi:inner membrane protein
MPSFVAHGLIGASLGAALHRRPFNWRYWFVVLFLPVMPDLDVGLMTFGVPYEHMFGHRGIMHSLPFALLVGFGVVTWVFSEVKRGSRAWWLWGTFFTALTASHGLLDMLTNGGHGIALLAPFSGERYFFPERWQVIEVSPFDWRMLVSRRGLTPWGKAILLSEFKYAIGPALAIGSVLLAGRALRPRRAPVADAPTPGAGAG